MVKEKTISVRHYVKKNLNPKVIENKNYYPVYVQVNFNRKNSQFKLLIFGRPIYVLESLGLDDPNFVDFKKEIANDVSMIEEIVKYEKKILQKDFELKGIGTRLTIYKKKIKVAFELLSIEFIHEFLKDVMTFRGYNEMLSIDSFIDKIYFAMDGNLIKRSKKDMSIRRNNKADSEGMQIVIFFGTIIFLENKNNIKNEISLFELLVKNKKEVYIKMFKSKLIENLGVNALDKPLNHFFDDKRNTPQDVHDAFNFSLKEYFNNFSVLEKVIVKELVMV